MPEDDREMRCGAITSEEDGRRKGEVLRLRQPAAGRCTGLSLGVGAVTRGHDVRPQSDRQFAFVTLD